MLPDELETQVEEQFAPVENEVSPEEPSTDAQPETAPAEPRSPQAYTIDGTELSETQLKAALGFSKWTEQNPDKFAKIVEWERAGYDASVFAPQPAPVEEELDVYSEDYLKGLNQRLGAMEQEITGRSKREGEAAIEEGVQRFLGSHQDLEQADVDQIFKWVHDREVLRSIPQDATPSKVVSEVAQRFEEGYRNVFFERARNDATTEIVKDQAKRRRAASASSSAASSPRSSSPNTPEERKSWMLDTIREAMAENP